VARLDGAVAGTPFFIALVPGYMSYLWQEARMGLRTAALYGRDPAGLQTAAEMLALRGVHPTPDAAEKALTAVRDSPQPEKPSTRRPLRTWIHSGYLLLVFGGFLSAPDDEGEAPEAGHSRLRELGGMVVGGVIWLATWVFPVTLMIAMAWGCESHTRQLGRRLLVFYDGEAASAEDAIAEADKRQDKGHDRRAVLRAGALALSVIIPIVFIALVDHERQSTGMNWLGALGALVALSLVVAITVIANRK